MKKKNFIFDSFAYVLIKNWWLTVSLLIITVVSMSLQLVPAFIIRKLIDESFIKGNLQDLWLLAVIYLLAQAGTNLTAFLKVIITTILGQKTISSLRLTMADRLSELSIKYFTNTPVGDVMSRLTTDIDAINTLFSAGIIEVVTDLLKIVGLLVSLYIIAPSLLWLEIAFIPLIFLMSNFFSKNIFKFQKIVRKRISDIYTFIQEWLNGIKTVKAYSLEKIGEEKFDEPLRNHLFAISSISFYDSWFPCVMQTSRAVIIALSIWLATKNGTVLSLAVSTGTLAAIVDLVGRLFAPIEALALELQTIQQAMAGIARVKEFFNEPIEQREYVDQTVDESRGIEVNGVTFAYSSVNVLDNICVNLRPGSKSVFIGRSGVGKTTLMNIIAGLYSPDKGSVRIYGVDPFTLPPQKRRRLVGVVEQSPQIYDGSIRENISLNDDTITLSEIDKAIAIVGLDELIDSLPNGYDTLIGEGAAGLSTGEVQLLSLARAIVANPKILLLDEPTSGMDSQTEQKVFSAIRMAGEGRTIFSISHRFSGIVDADYVYLLSVGRIIESGTSDELLKNNGWYSMYTRMENVGWGLL